MPINWKSRIPASLRDGQLARRVRRSLSEIPTPVARRSFLHPPWDWQPQPKLRAALGPIGRNDEAVVRHDDLLHDR